jgi:curved DNA-binding protein
VAVKFRDYYEVLGVPRTASEQDIKRAYRRLARKHHPDLQPPAERTKASQEFKEINEAYEVLHDADKRAKYDALGENWKHGADFTPPPGNAPGRERTADTSVDWDDLGGFSDFFASMFGGARGGGAPFGRERRNVHVTVPGSDIEAELPVTLDDLLHGGRKRLTLDGHSIEAQIPIGVRDGTVLRLAGQGGPGIGGGPPGDLYLHVRLLRDPRFRVHGDDLETDLPLQPWQAVLGDEVPFETPTGKVTVKVAPGSQNGRKLRLRGRGLPRKDGTSGDLVAVIHIVVPRHPTPAEREAYEGLKRAATQR